MKIPSPTARPWHLPSPAHLATFYVAALLTILLCRRFIFEASDPYKCRALLETGQWYDEHTWLPAGCNTEPYGLDPINDCARGRRIVLAGDLSLQGTYWAMVRKTNGDVGAQPPVEADLHYVNDDVELECIWDPHLNQSQVFRYAQAYRHGWDEAPMLMVVGGGSFYAQDDDVMGHVGLMSTPRRRSGRHASFRTGAGVLSDGQGAQAIQDMNDELGMLASTGAIDVLWSFAEMTSGSASSRTHPMPYASDEVEDARADVLLGLRCNAKAANRGFFPNTRTCCATWRAPNWIQSTFLSLAAPYSAPYAPSPQSSAYNTSPTDRTHLFEQTRRLPLELPNLRNMILIVLLIGILSIRRSKPPKNSSTQPFLSRDQTEEWKGWMQALILLYHYNMAWTATWFWQIIRLAVASYLFLTGFGHTVYFLQKQDLSLRRVAAVMLRTNLLPVTLALGVVAIKRDWSERTMPLLCKIAASAALVQAFLRTEGLAEAVVKVPQLVFNLSFDATAFFGLRVKSDAYIVYIGMLTAILHTHALTTPHHRSWPALKPLTITLSALLLPAFFTTTTRHPRTQPSFLALQPYITPLTILTYLVLRNAHPVLRDYHAAAFAWLGRYWGEMYVLQDHVWLGGDQEGVLRLGVWRGGDESVGGDRWRDLVCLTGLFLVACAVVGKATWVVVRRWVVEGEVEMGLLGRGGGRGFEGKRVRGWTWWGWWKGGLWPAAVRDRVLLVLGILWFLNLTYT
ncbi:Cas1p-domain-containing protein [Teratosphaeria nubilosa]|uniref:Cas1p-domain-containing protein n=1 Tax=Teratosphaeria nubilosa TaxID=161662 RepID=A0A6G1L089_9PEZI|nr:Cas1p-domain-containing protein [Teratosphaeria nubilosa]